MDLYLPQRTEADEDRCETCPSSEEDEKRRESFKVALLWIVTTKPQSSFWSCLHPSWEWPLLCWVGVFSGCLFFGQWTTNEFHYLFIENSGTQQSRNIIMKCRIIILLRNRQTFEWESSIIWKTPLLTVGNGWRRIYCVVESLSERFIKARGISERRHATSYERSGRKFAAGKSNNNNNALSANVWIGGGTDVLVLFPCQQQLLLLLRRRPRR